MIVDAERGARPSTNVIATAVSDGVVGVTNSFGGGDRSGTSRRLRGDAGQPNINEGVTLTVTNNATDGDLPQVLTYAFGDRTGKGRTLDNGVITGRQQGRRPETRT